MTASAQGVQVHGRVDAAGRLTMADPKLAALHARAGGEEGGVLAVPQIASVARLAHRLGIVVSRPAIAADGDMDLDLWVRAQPEGEDVALAISGWKLREPHNPVAAREDQREEDFLRAESEWSWQTDKGLRFTALSPAAAAAIGTTEVELIGKQITRLFRLQEDQDGSLAILSALAEQRRFDNQLAELRGRKKQLCMLSGVPIFDEAGHFSGFHGSAAAVLDEQPAPLPTVDSSPTQSGAFAGQIETALRGPLDQIIAHAETIGEQPEGPLRRDYAGYARDIAVAGRHLLELVDDLVDLQAIERPGFHPEVEDIDLADVARRTAGLLSVRAASRNVRVEVPQEPESVAAIGDFRRVMQIVMNLVTNALRYSPEGGTVAIHVEMAREAALLSVIDQGVGIAEANQERIFEKFERLDISEPGGTGLGLYIARRLARAMGGELIVHSAPDQGARFTLSLPRQT